MTEHSGSSPQRGKFNYPNTNWLTLCKVTRSSLCSWWLSGILTSCHQPRASQPPSPHGTFSSLLILHAVGQKWKKQLPMYLWDGDQSYSADPPDPAHSALPAPEPRSGSPVLCGRHSRLSMVPSVHWFPLTRAFAHAVLSAAAFYHWATWTYSSFNIHLNLTSCGKYFIFCSHTNIYHKCMFYLFLQYFD